MKTCFLVFPHQLFDLTNFSPQEGQVYVVEEYLFFNQYKFHKQKIAFHRYTMMAYTDNLRSRGFQAHYVEAIVNHHDIRALIPYLALKGIEKIRCFDVVDNWLDKRLRTACDNHQIFLEVLTSPMFINSAKDIDEYAKDKKRYFQTDFYIYQRKKLNILIDDFGKPLNGKWSFDAENRLKYPKKKQPPKCPTFSQTPYHTEAFAYVEKYFKDNPGRLDGTIIYPHTEKDAREWFEVFLKERFSEFGVYEDAIVSDQNVLHHSVLTPMLNVGLLRPDYLINAAVQYATKHEVPYNSLEGFVRQILGWREFIRLVYIKVGSKERTTNFWKFDKKIPKSFYLGTTGIRPIDETIQKLILTGYNHHIERLMILSNFMLLCEYNPDEVYQWFMEMYIDAYDWVMVPNVYGMGQFADGGIMSTKPYISGSNYIIKMSDYPKGESWTKVWDALFWRFLDVHRSYFDSNIRMKMLINTFDKWDGDKKSQIHSTANEFLEKGFC